MEELLRRCNHRFNELPYCSKGSCPSDCQKCLEDGWFDKTTEDYCKCEKKLYYYVANYGPSFASEICHYLSASEILENKYSGKELRVLSLGCGASLDLIAINKYLQDNGISLRLKYHGVDISPLWKEIRPNIAGDITYSQGNIVNGINMSGFNFIVMSKVFSTINNNQLSNKYLDTVSNAIKDTLEAGAVLIFNDINNPYKAHKIFDEKIGPLFSNCRKYYFRKDSIYAKPDWIYIPNNENVFSIPEESGIIHPLPTVRDVIVFEYTK